jgi:hypothetical protein
VTIRTRRLLILAVFIVALTVPTEIVLLQALTQDGHTAAAAWARGLTTDEVEANSGHLELYPVHYRKELLRRLGPERGAAIWRRHIETYVNIHPELSSEQTEVLGTLVKLISPQGLAFPTSGERAALQVLGTRVGELFGKDVQRFLLHDLGPRTVGFSAQATPIGQRLQDFVRDHFVVDADEAKPCQCMAAFECDDTMEGNVICQDTALSGCTVITSWPACGFIWMEDCTGRCKQIFVE